MSRIGKKPILIPEGVDVKVLGNEITVKGPKGELSCKFLPGIKVEVIDKTVLISLSENTGKKLLSGQKKQVQSLWGLFRALIFNMVEGTVKGFEKKLQIEGIGYKAVVEGDVLVLSVGFTNQVKLQIPKGIAVVITKNIVSISGIDKALVGQFAANIRRVKPPEPYKGKGIRYEGEKVRRKMGKKVVSSK